jgi:thymidylate synthase (FAD)
MNFKRIIMSDVKYVDMGVNLISSMGTDSTIVNAARVSTAKDNRFKTDVDSKDEGLIKYLAAHKHWTPFAHTAITLKLKVPIFVARQLLKHQVGGVVNEISRRYVDSTPEFYIPSEWRARPEKSIKQGSGGTMDFNDVYVKTSVAYALTAYEDALKNGVAPELARLVLPQNMMTEFYWTGSLLFFDRVRYYRVDAHAQQECKEIAELISAECEKLFPVAWRELSKNVLTVEKNNKSSFYSKLKFW